MTYGDGDPTISEECLERHAEAIRKGHNAYEDPLTGFWVHTSVALRANGRCCGVGCRHCPYPATEQARAGRRLLRPGDVLPQVRDRASE